MKSQIATSLALFASISTASAQDFDFDKRDVLTQSKVDQFCQTQVGGYYTEPMTETAVMLCEILKVSDRQSERLKELEEDIANLRKQIEER